MHFDGEDNIRCPECGSRNWVLDSLDYGMATEETFGSCCDCPHVWPVDLEELERQISAATCHKCGAEDCDIDADLLDDVRHCEHCHHFWPDKEGVELPHLNTQEIEQRLTLFERVTDVKLPRSKYRRSQLQEIAQRLNATRKCFVAIEPAKAGKERKEFQQRATLLLTIVEHKIKRLLSQ
jgi:hypothetical protein